MLLQRIAIQNFKSLKNVEIEPSGLTTLIGPNGAGKTNLALALKFLAEVHQHGLETAITRAGGIENIALRKQRRSKSPIVFDVKIGVDRRDGQHPLSGLRLLPAGLGEDVQSLVIAHTFSCKAFASGVRAEFVVLHETLKVTAVRKTGKLFGDQQEETVYEFERDDDGRCWTSDEAQEFALPEQDTPVDGHRTREHHRAFKIGKQELALDSRYVRNEFAWMLSRFLGNMGVYHFSPDRMKESGTPTPNPQLSLFGGNLPALVDWLRRKRKADWKQVLAAMQEMIPGLEDIRVEILPSKTLGIFFAETGFGRPWRVDEVSDGTLHVLSMLVACADPRVSALVIEEPESSLHPWAIKELGKRLRALSKSKTVIVTTQSPVFVDLLEPSEAWVVSRSKRETNIRRLTELDSQIEEDWLEGNVGLSEYLDAGLVPRAVPGGLQP